MNKDNNEDLGFNIPNITSMTSLLDSFNESSALVEQIKIHIRITQRNGRKCITTVEHLDKFDENPKFVDKITKYLRKQLSCGATVKDEKDGTGKVIQLSGDHREKISQFLVEKEICKKDDIKVHGF